MIYGSIYEADEWYHDYSDGYQILSELTYAESVQGACVQAIGITTGDQFVCHYVDGSVKSRPSGQKEYGTPVEGARQAPVSLTKFAFDIYKREKESTRWGVINTNGVHNTSWKEPDAVQHSGKVSTM